MINLTSVILCGGSSIRLWPLSRIGFPKQFLRLISIESLFQRAAQRLAKLGNADNQVARPLMGTGEDHLFLAAEQLHKTSVELGAALLNSGAATPAPAPTLASLTTIEARQDPILMVTPPTKRDVFAAASRQPTTEASMGSIVIFGTKPDRPETGYDYIKTAISPAPALSVERFAEEPDASADKNYIDEGCHYWNAGILLLKAAVWLKALKQFCPNIAQARTCRPKATTATPTWVMCQQTTTRIPWCMPPALSLTW